MALPVVVHPRCLRRKTARVRMSFEPPCPRGLTEWEIRNHRLGENHVFLFLGFSLPNTLFSTIWILVQLCTIYHMKLPLVNLNHHFRVGHNFVGNLEP